MECNRDNPFGRKHGGDIPPCQHMRHLLPERAAAAVIAGVSYHSSGGDRGSIATAATPSCHTPGNHPRGVNDGLCAAPSDLAAAATLGTGRHTPAGMFGIKSVSSSSNGEPIITNSAP